MKQLCVLCNREFSPRPKIVIVEKYGEPKKEIILGDTTCQDCLKDGGESEEILGEEIT